MRSYPANSPQAAARIVALSMLADSHVCANELQTLKREKLDKSLGITEDQFDSIVRALCEDLMCAAHLSWSDVCRPDSEAMRLVVREIQDPVMQAEVLRLCIATVRADGHIGAAEVSMLEALAHAWKIPLDARSLAEKGHAAHPLHTSTSTRSM